MGFDTIIIKHIYHFCNVFTIEYIGLLQCTYDYYKYIDL